MYKSTIRLLLLNAILVGSTLFASGQSWDYPVKPGSEEWAKLNDVSERIKACQIPEDIVTKLPTEELFTLCTKHPFFRSYAFANSPIEGFRNSMGSFNGYSELLKRPNALEVMADFYKKENFSRIDTLKTDIAKGEYSLRLHGVELMMSNDLLIGKLSAEKKKLFLKTIYAKYEEKLAYKEELGGFGSVTTAFLAAKVIPTIAELKVISVLPASKKMESFQTRMIPFDQDIVDPILKSLSASLALLN
ncbi:hypothetical protein [Spirosoma oryzicola]|uniref:hypothetical protein n=1 Tax=Spirosoma oryzicola TaxID=2898794 RepID=UPI001E5ED22B|nr:hypothetical protein [Spirosoma oryzicola]UHG93262.1 hypothetical protein LQ777_10255 [Spirosoma oryzicola]